MHAKEVETAITCSRAANFKIHTLGCNEDLQGSLRIWKTRVSRDEMAKSRYKRHYPALMHEDIPHLWEGAHVARL